MDHRPLLRGVLACLAGLLLTAAAQAQAFRTYLSFSGVDNSACGVATPCRLLPAALAAVADGGEVWILDSANYNTGPVAITKSVTILAVPGAVGSVVALGGNAISIATAGVKVTLRNLVIVPYLGNSGNGITMTAGAALTVEDCLIANIVGHGIVVNTPAILRVTDSTIRDNSNYGLFIQNGARAFVTGAMISGNGSAGVRVHGAADTTTADLGDSTIEANQYGVYAYATTGNTARVSVSDSRVIGQTYSGLVAEAQDTGPAILSVGNNRVSNNGYGIVAAGASAKVWASGNVISHNTTLGINVWSGSLFESAGDNAVRNNTVNSSGVITVLPKM